MSAEKKIGSAFKFYFINFFCTYFIQVVLDIGEYLPNVAHKKFCAHTDFKKLEGTLTDTR